MSRWSPQLLAALRVAWNCVLAAIHSRLFWMVEVVGGLLTNHLYFSSSAGVVFAFGSLVAVFVYSLLSELLPQEHRAILGIWLSSLLAAYVGGIPNNRYVCSHLLDDDRTLVMEFGVRRDRLTMGAVGYGFDSEAERKGDMRLLHGPSCMGPERVEKQAQVQIRGDMQEQVISAQQSWYIVIDYKTPATLPDAYTYLSFDEDRERRLQKREDPSVEMFNCACTGHWPYSK